MHKPRTLISQDEAPGKCEFVNIKAMFDYLFFNNKGSSKVIEMILEKKTLRSHNLYKVSYSKPYYFLL